MEDKVGAVGGEGEGFKDIGLVVEGQLGEVEDSRGREEEIHELVPFVGRLVFRRWVLLVIESLEWGGWRGLGKEGADGLDDVWKSDDEQHLDDGRVEHLFVTFP